MLGFVISFGVLLIGLLIIFYNKRIGSICYKNPWVFPTSILNSREYALAFGFVLLLLGLGSIFNQMYSWK